MKRSTLFAALLFSASSTSLTAAPVELTASTEGTGTFERGSSAARVSKANLVLKKDGKFFLGLVGAEDFRVQGRWSPGAGDDVVLRVTGAVEKDATGEGTVELRARRDGSFEVMRVNVAARTEKGSPVVVRFTANRPVVAPPPKAPAIVLDAERRGRGAFRTGGQRPVPFNKVHVKLWDNGTAHVHTEGGFESRYEGTWKDGGVETVLLTVRGGIKGEKLSGAARTRNGRVGRVELSGTVDGQFYSLEIDPVD